MHARLQKKSSFSHEKNKNSIDVSLQKNAFAIRSSLDPFIYITMRKNIAENIGNLERTENINLGTKCW